MKIFLALTISLTILFGSYAQEKSVTINGHKFAVYTKGLEHRKKNMPVVVFENGMGMGYENWDTVLDEIAKTAPVFAYDRAGVEKSEKVFEMPTVKRVADNLKALLTSLNIAPPYILVGHSMGGVYIRGYAGYYPADISGLLFVDPADFTESKDDWNSIFRSIGVPEKKIDEMMYDRLYGKSEVDSVRFGPWSEMQVLTELRRTDFAEMKSLPMPNAPIIFLVGGRFDVPPERRVKDYDHALFFRVKTDRNVERWRKLIDESPKGGTLMYLSNCGHYIHRDDPRAVIQAIRNIIDGIPLIKP